jgi:hypothetical protein
LCGFGLEDLQETVDEGGGFEDGLEEQEAAARVLVVGEGEECVAEIVVAVEALGSGDEPEVEFVFVGAEVGDELGVVALGVVDEVAGVDFEELCEEQAGGVGEVGAGSALDLGEIGLADGGLFAAVFRGIFGLDGSYEFLLGHGAVEAADVSFYFAEVADFFAEFHDLLRIAIIVLQFVINVKREIDRAASQTSC